MSLRFALLGFLSSTPATGYELAQEFARGAGSFWQALPSQIYPELRDLERLGLIAGRQDASDQLRRRRFHLTGEGEAALRLWVESALDYPPERDAERVQLIFLDDSPPEAIRAHLQRHLAHHEARRAVWRDMRKAVLAGEHRQHSARIRARPAERHDIVLKLKLLAIDGNLRRARSEIAWAKRALDWLRAAEASADPRRAAQRREEAPHAIRES